MGYLAYIESIGNKKLSKFEIPNIRPYFPTPNNTDYKRGYLTRYFIQRVNDINSIVYEISKSDYLTFIENDFFITTNLDWKLVGTNEEIQIINTKSINFASKKLPALKMYLVNPLQLINE